MKTAYRHSAYWHAYHYGRTFSEAGTYTGRYLDLRTYRPNARELANGEWSGKDWLSWRNGPVIFDSQFNPLMLGVCIAMDIGVAMRDEVKKLADPAERDRIKRELMRDLRIVRRPFYYARETKRRRELAAARRKISRRRTTAPMPTREDILAAWSVRKESREAMIRLGGMLHDLECYVDNCLRFDETGAVVGRNGGIRGWLKENLPELSPKYKTLMRYKALAMRVRQATNTKDPTPTATLLNEPRCKVVSALLADQEPVFDRLFAAVDRLVAPEAVFLDEPKKVRRRRLRRQPLRSKNLPARLPVNSPPE